MTIAEIGGLGLPQAFEALEFDAVEVGHQSGIDVILPPDQLRQAFRLREVTIAAGKTPLAAESE